MEPIDFSGQVAVATGAGGALGSAFCRELAPLAERPDIAFVKAAGERSCDDILARLGEIDDRSRYAVPLGEPDEMDTVLAARHAAGQG